MSLPSQILNVLPGGKYHEMANAVKIFPDTELQYRRTDISLSDSDWTNALFGDRDTFSDISFAHGFPLKWRLKPKTRRYRVALMQYRGRELYTTTTDEDIDVPQADVDPNFVKWLSDWKEYDA